jgi:hypothetical protein
MCGYYSIIFKVLLTCLNTTGLCERFIAANYSIFHY